jgi:hypothetical protein
MSHERAELGLWDYMRRRPSLGRKFEIVCILVAGLAAIIAILFSLW